MEWFKCLDDFKTDNDKMWNYDGSVLVNIAAWNNKESLESQLNTSYPALSVGERKGKKKHILRFLEEANEFALQVGNKSFHGAAKDYRDATIINLNKLWNTA